MCPKHIFDVCPCRIAKLGVVVHYGAVSCTITRSLLPLYSKFLNLILDSDFIPDTWLQGYLSPIYNKRPNGPV